MTDNCGFRIDSDDNLTLCDGTENFVEDSEAGEQGNDTTACNPADAVENEDVILTPLKLFTIGKAIDFPYKPSIKLTNVICNNVNKETDTSCRLCRSMLPVSKSHHSNIPLFKASKTISIYILNM